MKAIILVFHFSFFIFHFTSGQQYGWTDLSANIPTMVDNASLTDVAVSGQAVWISSSNLKGVFRSENGGGSFVFDSLNVGIQGLYLFPDGQRGWAVGGAYGFHTEDAGENWTPVFIGSTLLSVTFANDSTGYVTGNGSVYRTDDAGATWARQSQIANLSNRDVMDAAFPDPVNALTGFVCVANPISTIFSTGNGGGSWESITLSWVTSSVNAFAFTDPGHGWGVGGESNIFRYENKTWTFQPTSFNINLNDVAATPGESDVWAVGNEGIIIHSNGSGDWTRQAAGMTQSYLQAVFAVSSTEAYVVGNDKTFLKWTNLQGLTEIMQGGMEVFPNPGRGIYNLRSRIYNLGSGVIELMDLYGKVLELSNPGTLEHWNPGTLEPWNPGTLQLDLTGCPAGVYFIRIIIDNEMIVKKIIKL